MKSYSKYILLILSLNIMLTACSETEVTEHIEVFVSESLEANEEGMFERKGYEKINSITTTERSEIISIQQSKRLRIIMTQRGVICIQRLFIPISKNQQ